jgi:uncharacterized protein HemY
VDLTPNEAAYLNTLGVAQYRNRLCKDAVATLEKSLALGNGKSDAYDLYFLALCLHHLGDGTKAKLCYDRAVRWHRETKLSANQIEELNAFRTEGERVLGLPGPQNP